MIEIARQMMKDSAHESRANDAQRYVLCWRRASYCSKSRSSQLRATKPIHVKEKATMFTNAVCSYHGESRGLVCKCIRPLSEPIWNTPLCTRGVTGLPVCCVLTVCHSSLRKPRLVAQADLLLQPPTGGLVRSPGHSHKKHHQTGEDVNSVNNLDARAIGWVVQSLGTLKAGRPMSRPEYLVSSIRSNLIQQTSA
jgi:hypothetical protein